MKADIRRCRAAGFTLIELLIAVSLTVMVGAISYRFLDAAIRVEALGNGQRQSVSALEQTWQLMAADLRSSTDRPVVVPATGIDFLPVSAQGDGDDGSRPQRPSMISAVYAEAPLAQIVSREGALLWFTRLGWENPLQQPRSGLQRILYRLDNDGNLYRDYWSEKNQPLSAQPDGSLLLLANVQTVQFAFLAAGDNPDADNWLPRWPPAASAAGLSDNEESQLPAVFLPAAVRVTMRLSEAVIDEHTQQQTGAVVYQRLFLTGL